MKKYHLSNEEDLRLHLSVQYPGDRYLYEFFVEMPLEDLKAYPRKGYRWWMGRKARTPQAMELCDYILYWRLFALEFRQKYPREYLESLHYDKIRLFVHTYIEKTPLWPYDEPLRDAIQILFEHKEPF